MHKLPAKCSRRTHFERWINWCVCVRVTSTHSNDINSGNVRQEMVVFSSINHSLPVDASCTFNIIQLSFINCVNAMPAIFSNYYLLLNGMCVRSVSCDVPCVKKLPTGIGDSAVCSMLHTWPHDSLLRARTLHTRICLRIGSRQSLLKRFNRTITIIISDNLIQSSVLT